jgi:restriction system protein
MTTMWMVRAGRSSIYVQDFLENSVVAIGWAELGDIDPTRSRDGLAEAIDKTYANDKEGARRVFTSVVYRFLQEICEGDRVVTYDSSRRVYHLGTIRSGYKYDLSTMPEMPRIRRVSWEAEIERDSLSTSARNSLGAIVTLFQLPGPVAMEIEAIASGASGPAEPQDGEAEATDEVVLADLKSRAREFIKDPLSRLDPYEMQNLVAGVLRAMGYKTKVSPPGADRGVDVTASKDGFGFEPPRIVVEVKHRKGAISSEQVRSFLGGRHKDDRGLYVSTGGFTKDARYEADRAQIPLTLMDVDLLLDTLIENYEQLDSDTKVLLPLSRMYWPVVGD